MDNNAPDHQASQPIDAADPFEAAVQDTLLSLPDKYRRAIDEVAIFVEDDPGPELLEDLGLEPGEGLFGLYTGTALTERSVDQDFDLPPQIQIFRDPLMQHAQDMAAELGEPYKELLAEEIRVTLLHELGHHFGLDEDQLEELGYG